MYLKISFFFAFFSFLLLFNLMYLKSYFLVFFSFSLLTLYRCADSILSCLVQISVDPYYRTINGFFELLRKDWFLEGYNILFYLTLHYYYYSLYFSFFIILSPHLFLIPF